MSKYMIIDGNRVEFDKEKNILQVVNKAGIHLPTFCYYSDLSIYGACRMCVVEDQQGDIIASCSTPPKDKMVIRTNSPKLHQYRKMILELILATHCGNCTTCEKNGVCRLQLLAGRYGLKEVRFKKEEKRYKIDKSSKSIVRNPNKCILCGACVRVCNEVQNVGAIDFANRGANMIVSPAFHKKLAETDCVNCGQCSAVCPTAAITIAKSTKEVWKAIYDPTKRVVAQVAPAVRVAIGESFGIAPGKNTIGMVFRAMRMLGFDKIYDTSVGADLTIMEEVSELTCKLENGSRKYPLFTSCCPAWIRYAETKHPELLPYISSCKSPMEIFGSVLKEYFKEQDAKDGQETISVAIMPCVAKKSEAARKEFQKNGIPDIDYVLTTNELVHMIKEIGIQYSEIEPDSPDMPFAIYSGSGIIFGATGGVMEAALRKISYNKGFYNLKALEYSGIRGMEGIKTAEVTLGDETLRVAAVSGLGNTEKLIQKIESGEEHFDFVEVMACPGGCISGAGQPFSRRTTKQQRIAGLYKSDLMSVIKRSDENPIVQKLYEWDFLKGKEHELLHIDYTK